MLLGERGAYCAAGPECRGGGPPPALWRGDLRQAHLHRLPQRQHPRRHQELQEAYADLPRLSLSVSLCRSLSLSVCPLEPQQLGMGGRNKVGRQDPCSFFL